MTKLEEKQDQYINELKNQIMNLSMMSKIELGDDVIEELNRLDEEIHELKQNYVPFISEVEEFNALMGNQIIIPRTYPRKKSGCSFIISF
jgi:hypothetical protein